MARIRSVHPGLFTDDAFMAASLPARLLIIGLWGQAWDDGVFEWKPLTLKARIFPVDNVDVGDLLAELVSRNVVVGYGLNGKELGAIRNFCRFQRPKKPNSSKLLPDELRTYVGLSPPSSEPVENQFPTSGEKSPQMEEGGREEGRKKDINNKSGGEGSAREAKNGVYAFNCGVVKLSRPDLDRWIDAFPAVAVKAELTAAEPWLAKQPHWFNAAASLLAKKQREATKPTVVYAEPPISDIRKGF